MRADEQSPSLVSSEAIRTHDDRSVLASRTSPTSNSQLTMSHTTELSKILDLIARSSYGSVSRFLDDLLTSKRYQKHSSVSDLHDPGNISKILNLLWKHQRESAVTDWTAERMVHTCREEIKTVTQKSQGLHFNASNARAEDITYWKLESVAEKYQKVAPYSWSLIQDLLDADKGQRRRFEPTKVKRYENRHEDEELSGVDTTPMSRNVQRGQANSNAFIMEHIERVLDIILTIFPPPALIPAPPAAGPIRVVAPFPNNTGVHTFGAPPLVPSLPAQTLGLDQSTDDVQKQCGACQKFGHTSKS